MANINLLKQSHQTLGDFVVPSFTVTTTPTGSPAKVASYAGGYSISTGDYPSFHFVVTLADLTALGAFTTGDIVLATLPPGTAVLRTLQKHEIALTDAVGGTGANVLLSAATCQPVTVNVNAAAGAAANHSYGTAFNVFQAPSVTAFDYDKGPLASSIG